MKIGIIGLGLMGGSLGLALQEQRSISEIYGYDISKNNQEKALNLNLVHKIIDLENMQKKCDIIFLAIPVDAIIKILNNFKHISDNTTIIDLGSTKFEILKNIPSKIRGNFVASHPMTGTEYSGPLAAKKDLYKDSVLVICDFEQSEDVHLKRAIELFSHLGMKIMFMDAKEHDKHVGIISHLPHAIAFSLASGVLKQEDKKNIVSLGGPTFSGMIRVAKSSPEMWQEIFKQNKNNLLDAISIFKKELEICENHIKNNEWKELHNWMNLARNIKEIL